MIERLAAAQLAEVTASFTFFSYCDDRLTIGQGADGFSFYSANLEGIEAFAQVALECEEMFVADDHWLSAFLANKGVPIKSLAHTLHGELCYEQSHSINQLRFLDGKWARARAVNIGLSHLERKGLLRSKGGQRGLAGKLRAFWLRLTTFRTAGADDALNTDR